MEILLFQDDYVDIYIVDINYMYNTYTHSYIPIYNIYI